MDPPEQKGSYEDDSTPEKIASSYSRSKNYYAEEAPAAPRVRAALRSNRHYNNDDESRNEESIETPVKSNVTNNSTRRVAVASLRPEKTALKGALKKNNTTTTTILRRISEDNISQPSTDFKTGPSADFTAETAESDTIRSNSILTLESDVAESRSILRTGNAGGYRERSGGRRTSGVSFCSVEIRQDTQQEGSIITLDDYEATHRKPKKYAQEPFIPKDATEKQSQSTIPTRVSAQRSSQVGNATAVPQKSLYGDFEDKFQSSKMKKKKGGWLRFFGRKKKNALDSM